jgi:hypothetical protein
MSHGQLVVLDLVDEALRSEDHISSEVAEMFLAIFDGETQATLMADALRLTRTLTKESTCPTIVSVPTL